jgi:carbon storage regulator CsrA
MLVLSRRLNQKVVFPGIEAAVQVLGVKGGVVRLGIEAPPGVTVLRQEVHDRQREWGAGTPRRCAAAPAVAGEPPRLSDGLRDAGVGLGLAQLLLDAGRTEEAKATLRSVGEQVRVLRRGADGEPRVAPGPGPAPRKALRALLVEDDRNQRELLAGLLRLSGLEVDTAGDGADALEYLRARGRPDVVLLDMVLPRVDGPAAVRAIRGDPTCAGLKIFGVTGHLPDEFDLESGPAGVDRWFHKPLDPSALVQDLADELCGAPA